MSLLDDTPTCGALGCHEPATARVRHPEKGSIVACEGHADDYDVIEEIA